MIIHAVTSSFWVVSIGKRTLHGNATVDIKGADYSPDLLLVSVYRAGVRECHNILRAVTRQASSKKHRSGCYEILTHIL